MGHHGLVVDRRAQLTAGARGPALRRGAISAARRAESAARNYLGLLSSLFPFPFPWFGCCSKGIFVERVGQKPRAALLQQLPLLPAPWLRHLEEARVGHQLKILVPEATFPPGSESLGLFDVGTPQTRHHPAGFPPEHLESPQWPHPSQDEVSHI